MVWVDRLRDRARVPSIVKTPLYEERSPLRTVPDDAFLPRIGRFCTIETRLAVRFGHRCRMVPSLCGTAGASTTAAVLRKNATDWDARAPAVRRVTDGKRYGATIASKKRSESTHRSAGAPPLARTLFLGIGSTFSTAWYSFPRTPKPSRVAPNPTGLWGHHPRVLTS